MRRSKKRDFRYQYIVNIIIIIESMEGNIGNLGKISNPNYI
jgi:hypothetical protein